MAFDFNVDLFSWIATLKQQTKIFQWVSLLFQIAFSSTVSFLFVCGSTLTATRSWPLAIGSGMITVAVVMAVFFRRSPLTKGMIFVAPLEEAKQEIETDIQVTSK